MLRFAADENFDNDIVRGLRRRDAEIDIVRIQDTECAGAGDRTTLDWAAREGRLVLTHDAATMTRHAYDRIRQGLPMPGVIEVKCGEAVGRVIDDILLVARCCTEGDLEGRMLYVPLR